MTCFNIGMIYARQGELDRAIEYIERTVMLDEQVQHPDLESDRAALRRLKQMRDGGETAPDPQQEVIQAIVARYRQDGADGVREMLSEAGLSEAQIEDIIQQLRQAFDQ